MHMIATEKTDIMQHPKVNGCVAGQLIRAIPVRSAIIDGQWSTPHAVHMLIAWPLHHTPSSVADHVPYSVLLCLFAQHLTDRS